MAGPRARAIALFLDFDGTLVEIAPTPDAVRPADGLTGLLDDLRTHLQGAVAIVSGRPVAEIDRWLAPLRLAVAGQHGMELRPADGAGGAPGRAPELDPVRQALAGLSTRHPGLAVEDKGLAVAVHYREAPLLADLVLALTERLQLEGEGRIARIPGKMVVELLPAGGGKGGAIERFLAAAPFAGRLPVFLGDDVTDEDGFAAVNRLGGVSVLVGAARATAAGHRLDDVAAVHAWLGALARAASDSPQESFPWGPLISA
ncbi:MAG: trehalose-phosphatase [Geminicoccaceae bacterium]